MPRGKQASGSFFRRARTLSDLVLFQPSGAWGTPSISPFCMKLELYLKLTGLPYRVCPPNLRQAPRGKVPYIELDGQRLGDSQLIIEHLKRRFGDPLDEWLTPEQRHTGHLLRRTLEESTYWALGYMRWVDPEGWETIREPFKKTIPGPLRHVAPYVIRFLRKRALHAQGTGRHSTETVVKMAGEDYDAVAGVLGDSPFLFGEKPSSYDCTAFAFTVALLAFPVESALKRHVHGLTNLTAYVERLRQAYFA